MIPNFNSENTMSKAPRIKYSIVCAQSWGRRDFSENEKDLTIKEKNL